MKSCRMIGGCAALTVAMLVPHIARAQAAQPVTTGASTPVVTFSGELRSRSEWDSPGASIHKDLFTYLRSRLGVRVDINSGTHVVLQAQDSRVLGIPETNATTHILDLHQGYLELTGPVRGIDAAARVGRQEIALGNERLVGVVNWSNVGRSFDGARFTISQPRSSANTQQGPAAPAWTATAFVADVEERGRHFGTPTSTTDGDHFAAALYGSRAFTSRETIDATLLHDAASNYRTYQNSTRTTLDGRFRTTRLAGLSTEVEAAAQIGSQDVSVTTGTTTELRSQDVSAWLIGARIGKPSFSSRHASLGAGLDILSGDATPADKRYTAFSTMFASNHLFYGLMDIVGDPATTTHERGLVDAFATASMTLTPRVNVKSELHHFALQSGDDKPLAWELDLTLPVKLGPAATVELGYSALRGDVAAPALGIAAKDAMRHWAYLQLRAGF